MIKSVEIVLTTHRRMRQRRHTRLNPCSLPPAVARRHEKAGRPSRSVPYRGLTQTSTTLIRPAAWGQGQTLVKSQPFPVSYNTEDKTRSQYHTVWGLVPLHKRLRQVSACSRSTDLPTEAWQSTSSDPITVVVDLSMALLSACPYTVAHDKRITMG